MGEERGGGGRMLTQSVFSPLGTTWDDERHNTCLPAQRHIALGGVVSMYTILLDPAWAGSCGGTQADCILVRVTKCRLDVLQVICTEGTQAAVRTARAEQRSTWRISSTVFGHVQSDQILRPLGHFAQAPAAASYPPIAAGTFVQHELEAINLKKA